MELLKVSLEDPRPWKQAVDAIHYFLPEAVFYFDSDGVHLRAIDPSQVVLVDLFAPKGVFSRYELSDSPLRVPLNLTEYTKVLARVTGEDRMRMALEDVNLSIVLERADGSLRREFYVPLIDVPDTDVNVSPPEGSVTVSVLGRVLKDALKDADIFSTSAVLVARDDTFLVEAKGQSGVTRTVVRNGDLLKVEGGPEAVSRYSLPILQSIVRPADSDTVITLRFGNDTPLHISYSVGGIRMAFYLAHMIL